MGTLQRIPSALAVAAMLSLAASGCGRVGYDLLRSDGLAARGDAAFDGTVTFHDGSAADARRADGSDGARTGLEPCPAVVPTVGDPCDTIPALPVAPFIDGLPECGLPLYTVYPQGWDADGATPDSVAAYGVAWRPNGIYFFVRVTDPTAVPPEPNQPASYGDGIELYVDSDGSFAAPPAYDDPGTRRFVIAAPADATTPEARGEIWRDSVEVASAWSSSSFRVYPRSFGYVVEAYVTAADLGLPSIDLAAGGSVAWDLAVDVSYPTASSTGPSGHRLGRFFVRSSNPSPDTNVAAFCRARLLAE